MMAVKLWGTVLLSLALSGFCCDAVTTSTNTTETTGSPMINATSAAKNATSLSTVTTTTIKDQSSQSPDNQTVKKYRLEKNIEAGPRITAGTIESSTKIPMTSVSSLAPTISDNSTLINQERQEDVSYNGIILSVVIALIIISVVVFLLMALYRMCLKTTPERQENGTEQAPSNKENVKLISVKTTSQDSAEHMSQGRNKTRQHNDSPSCQGNKCVCSRFYLYLLNAE